MGSSWLADRLWERLEIAKTIIAAAGGRRLQAERVERAIFAMVANRLSVKPLSKLAGCEWVGERAFIEGLAEVSDDACYRAMDFLHAALPELQERVFFCVANLLDLEVDLLFFDTTSTYWETDRLPDALQDEEDEADADAERSLPESGQRRYSKNSKDHRPDLPQVMVGMAVTRKGIPVRVWTFPRPRLRSGDHPQGPRRPARLEPRAGNLGAGPRLHLRAQPPLSAARRRPLHRRREAPLRQQGGQRGARPPGPLPHGRREPARQAG